MDTFSKHPTWRLLPLGALLLVLLVVLWPLTVALADAPITRGPEGQGVGGTGGTATTAGSAAADDAAAWRGVQMLPPPSMPARGSPTALRYQQGGEGGAIAWLGRNLNPGNWILDAGMGIFAGIVKMFGGIMQKAVGTFLGEAGSVSGSAATFRADNAPAPAWSVVPSGCDNAATNFVFCTPANLTYAHPGVQIVWTILRGIAGGLVTILFTVRLGRMIVEGPRTLTTEGKALLLSFLGSMTFIQATQPIGQLLVEFFNGLSSLLLSRAALALPSQDVGDLNLGSNILFLVLWLLILLLTLKSFGRLVQIIVLLAMAPIAGALLIDRSTSNRFRSWFEKLVELLLAQINLVIIFIVIAAILQPYQGQGAGDAFVGFLLSIVMMGMALRGQSVIGIAGSALSGGGGGITSFLRYQLAGRMLGGRANRGGGRTRSTPDGSAASGAPITQKADATAGQDAGQRTSARAGGDPTQSVAAQRQSVSGANDLNRPAPSGAFRLADAGDGFRANRGLGRYRAAISTGAGADSGRPADARREQAVIRAGLMRRRASELRASGDRSGADTLERKARLQARFGRGGDISRGSRFSSADRAMRRQTYRQALGEVAGMHALERDALTQQAALDEARLPVLQRTLAMVGSIGGDTSTLYQEHQELQQRQALNQARLRALTPGEGQQVPEATRAAAAALANTRLPQELRSARYAMRHGPAAKGSAFIKRITGAPTQGARDELARARAVAVKAAQLPAAARPPIAPARRQEQQRRGARPGPRRAAKRPPTTSAPAESEAAPPARVRSSTIAMLRARRQREGSGQVGVPPDTPSPSPREEARDDGTRGARLRWGRARRSEDTEG